MNVRNKLKYPFVILFYDLGLESSMLADMFFLCVYVCSEKFHEIYNFAFGWAKEKVNKACSEVVAIARCSLFVSDNLHLLKCFRDRSLLL